LRKELGDIVTGGQAAHLRNITQLAASLLRDSRYTKQEEHRLLTVLRALGASKWRQTCHLTDTSRSLAAGERRQIC